MDASGGGRREEKNVKQTYRVLASLIALGVLVQAAAVAFGWFEVISEVENGAVFDENAEFNLGQLNPATTRPCSAPT